MRTLNSHHFSSSEIPLTFLAVIEDDLVLRAVKEEVMDLKYGHSALEVCMNS